jgi:hypothetical protein
MPFISPTSTCSGGQANVDNIYLLKGQPVPSGTVLEQPVLVSLIGLRSADSASTASMGIRGLQNDAPYPYTGAVNISPAASSLGPASDGLTIRSIATGVQVEVGTDGQAVNKLMIAGPSGLSQVYDQVYNPAIKGTAIIDVTTSLNTAVPNEGTRQFTFNAPVTGAYMLQVDINLFNADVVPTVNEPIIGLSGTVIGGLIQPAGAVEWTLTTLPPQAAGEVQYMSSTIAGASLIKQSQLAAVAEPMDFTTSNMGFLLGGGNYNINLYAIKPNPDLNVINGDWNLSNIKIRLVQMC